MRRGSASLLMLVVLVGCGDKARKVTREDCAKVADHIAALRLADLVKNPEELWDRIHSEPGDTGLPSSVTRESLQAFLATPEGKTWLMKRQAHIRAGAELGMAGCLAKATPRLIDCLLAAKTREAVVACDAVK